LPLVCLTAIPDALGHVFVWHLVENTIWCH
jgi:hypothetical protein